MYKRVTNITKFLSLKKYNIERIFIVCLIYFRDVLWVVPCLDGHGIIDSLSPEIYILKRLVLRWMKRRKAFLWSIERALFSVFWLIFSFFISEIWKGWFWWGWKEERHFAGNILGRIERCPVFVFWFREDFPCHFFSSKVWKHLSQHNSTTLKIVSRSRAEESAVVQ